ncbi:P-II family nitrogen regulator [Candidatus Desantisbacteria bacterium]|nr:P-II family nitrogen regulator [Candidatus Desantisbacteria bacterium]
MKKIVAIIHPEKADKVRCALKKFGYLCSGIEKKKGNDKQKYTMKKNRNENFTIGIVPKIMVELLVEDSEVERIVKTIVKNSDIGEIGDNKIFIHSAD